MEHLARFMLGYQWYNFLPPFFIKDLWAPEMLLHHLSTGTLAWLGLHPFCHYYG